MSARDLTQNGRFEADDRRALECAEAAMQSVADAKAGYPWTIEEVCRATRRDLPVSHDDLVRWARFARLWGFRTNVDADLRAMPEIWAEVER